MLLSITYLHWCNCLPSLAWMCRKKEGKRRKVIGKYNTNLMHNISLIEYHKNFRLIKFSIFNGQNIQRHCIPTFKKIPCDDYRPIYRPLFASTDLTDWACNLRGHLILSYFKRQICRCGGMGWIGHYPLAPVTVWMRAWEPAAVR